MFNEISPKTVPITLPDASTVAPLASTGRTASASRRHRKPQRTELSISSAAAYAKDTRLFIEGGGVIPCDATMLMSWIAANRLKIAPTSLYRRAMAVRYAHLSQGLPSPTDDPSIRPLLRSMQLGFVPDKKRPVGDGDNRPVNAKRREPKAAPPVTRRLLLQMQDAMGRNLLDLRDKALMLLGFMGAMKRSTLLAINLRDLRFTQDALIVTLRDASTPDDRGGSNIAKNAGATVRQVAVPKTGGELCAATAVQQWCERAALDLEPNDGPLFRRFDRGGDPTRDRLNAAYVNVILKTRLKDVGIDSRSFSAQSLRRGRLLELGKGTL